MAAGIYDAGVGWKSRRKRSLGEGMFHGMQCLSGLSLVSVPEISAAHGCNFSVIAPDAASPTEPPPSRS